MWLSRQAYENLVKRNDDRDFKAMLTEVERLRSDVRGLRTWLQRNLDKLHDDGDGEPEANGGLVEPVPGGWVTR